MFNFSPHYKWLSATPSTRNLKALVEFITENEFFSQWSVANHIPANNTNNKVAINMSIGSVVSVEMIELTAQEEYFEKINLNKKLD